MPFTLSHPAAVLPLSRLLGRYAVFSALVIGSMAPDFPYYAALGLPRTWTHSLGSVLWFSLPAGWAVLLAHRYGLRAAALEVAPRGLRARLPEKPPATPFFATSLSLMVGALTHVAWDGATHSSHLLAKWFPPLRSDLLEVGGDPLWSYEILQHGSTLVGAIAIAIALRRWKQRIPARALSASAPSERRRRRIARAVLWIVPPLVGLGFALDRAEPFRDWVSFMWFIVVATVAALSATFLVVAGVAVARWLERVGPAARVRQEDA
jgi:hypothetical protein